MGLRNLPSLLWQNLAGTVTVRPRVLVASTGLTLVDGLDGTAVLSAGSAFCGASVYLSGNQSLADNTNVAITWDSEYYDTNGMHSASSSQLVIPAGKGGYWRASGLTVFDVNDVGQRYVALILNGGDSWDLALGIPPGAASYYSEMAWSIDLGPLAAADYLEVWVYQNSGGALNLKGGSYRTRFQMHFLGA